MKEERQRWYLLTFDCSFSSLAERIIAKEFKDGNACGFDIGDATRNRISSRYIHVDKVTNVISHPYGAKEEHELTLYTVFNFEIYLVSKNKAVLKIINPPSSLKGFVNTMVSLCNNEFTISKIMFDVEHVYAWLLLYKDINRCVVSKVFVSGISIDSKSSAKISISSEGDAFSALKSKYKKNDYILDKIQVRCRYKSEDNNLSVSSSGSLICSTDMSPVIKKYVLDCVSNA